MVDAGRAKEKVLDSHGAASKYEVAWISKASAEQRAGRAGRTGPGHCYRCELPAHDALSADRLTCLYSASPRHCLVPG